MDTCKIAVSRTILAHKLPYGDPFWKTFNASFVNANLEPQHILQAVYDGHSITTQHKDHWRASENYICGQHIGLDFDTGDETSSIPYLLKDRFINRYASFLYTTMSHTPDHPRARVIFVLDQPIMQAKNYTLAAAALLWVFGTADRQCKDAARFFYGALDCEFEFINGILPLDTVKKLIAQYQESGAGEKRKAVHKDYAAPASQQEVQDALRLIPPWGVSYDEWVEILMGIHAQFGEAGYGLAEAWADGKKGEVEQKWRSFDQGGNTTGTVTIATVFGIAKRFGWKRDNLKC